LVAVPSVRDRLAADERERIVDEPGLPHAMREALLEALFASGANLLILPVQDVFGWRERINQPATIGEENWRWRLPWPSDRLQTEPQAIAVANQLREWSQRHGR
jgi:4-alpha-glucanotransferase